MTEHRPLVDRLKGANVSTILRVVAFVCFVLAFLIVVASASLGFEAEGWAYLGLSLWVLSTLIP